MVFRGTETVQEWLKNADLKMVLLHGAEKKSAFDLGWAHWVGFRARLTPPPCLVRGVSVATREATGGLVVDKLVESVMSDLDWILSSPVCSPDYPPAILVWDPNLSDSIPMDTCLAPCS